MPHGLQPANQMPAANRPPLKLLVFTCRPPKRTSVPGPSAPGDVPAMAGPVVTSGGVGEPRMNHSKYSARAHTRSSGQAPQLQFSPRVVVGGAATVDDAAGASVA